VRSARWAGPTDADRNEALLAELSQAGALTPEARLARFVCSAACAIAGGDIVVATGESRGRILTQPTGGAGGFGYDPLFFCPELGATFAQAGDEAKNTVSHRARAFRLLISRCACFMP
jgi:XTP/dITP diphosphohydrolase